MVDKAISEEPGKILIVDDNRIIRHLLKLTFTNSAHLTVLETDSADNALPIILLERPGIIILDVMMPGSMNGIELCQLLKSREDTQKIKIIILSAKAEDEASAEALSAGADFYTVKPFSPAKLLKLISDIHIN